VLSPQEIADVRERAFADEAEELAVMKAKSPFKELPVTEQRLPQHR
jgi:hypothetical protein